MVVYGAFQYIVNVTCTTMHCHQKSVHVSNHLLGFCGCLLGRSVFPRETELHFFLSFFLMWLPPISHFLGRLQGRIFFFSESTVLLAGGVAAPGLGPLARSGGRHRRHHHDPADGDVAHGEVPARMSPCLGAWPTLQSLPGERGLPSVSQAR